MPRRPRGYATYTPSELHRLLVAREDRAVLPPPALWDGDDWHGWQALFCPFYTNLAGPLGSDWGVVLNPTSQRFGLLTFEHDWCGCRDHPRGVGTQSGRDWERRRKEPA